MNSGFIANIFWSIYYGTLPCNRCPFSTIFLQVLNMDLHRKSQVHRWCSPVVKSIEHNSPVVKWETLYLPVHMNAVQFSLPDCSDTVLLIFIHI